MTFRDTEKSCFLVDGEVILFMNSGCWQDTVLRTAVIWHMCLQRFLEIVLSRLKSQELEITFAIISTVIILGYGLTAHGAAISLGI